MANRKSSSSALSSARERLPIFALQSGSDLVKLVCVSRSGLVEGRIILMKLKAEAQIQPACVEAGHVLEVFGGGHHGDQQQPLHCPRRQHHSRIDDFESLQIHHCHNEAARAGPAVFCNAPEVVRGFEADMLPVVY